MDHVYSFNFGPVWASGPLGALEVDKVRVSSDDCRWQLQ